jgi:hypothetical protein
LEIRVASEVSRRVLTSRDDPHHCHVTLVAPALQPRIGQANPLAFIRLEAGDDASRWPLPVGVAELEPVGKRVLAARSDVPPGEWLVWPDSAWALWIGDRPDALPEPVRSGMVRGQPEDVIAMIDQLASVGVWCREAALLLPDGWTPARRADAVLEVLEASRATAMSGVFVDRAGRSARLELSAGSVCWTDCPVTALEWLLIAMDLPAPA